MNRRGVNDRADLSPVRRLQHDLFPPYRLASSQGAGERELGHAQLPPVATPIGDQIQQFLWGLIRVAQTVDDSSRFTVD